MRVVVTGGAGFIGSHVVDALVARGDTVLVIDDLSTGERENVNHKARLVEMRVQDPAVRAVVEGFRADALVHCAAQTSVPRSWEDPLEDADANVKGIVNVLEACVAASCKRVVYLSSAAVYGEPEYLPIDEEHPIRPTSPYGVSKYTGEVYLRAYAERYALSAHALRCSNVYGWRQKAGIDGGVIACFVEALRMNCAAEATLRVFGDGQQTRDFIFVGDVSDAVLTTLALDASRGLFTPLNVSTSTEVSVNELVHTLCAAAGHRRLGVAHEPERPGDLRRSCLSNRNSLRLLGWRPRVTLREGLTRLVGNRPDEELIGVPTARESR